MASRWLHGEIHREVDAARVLSAQGTPVVYLHYRRGELRVSPLAEIVGFERATRMRMPLDKTDEDLREWMAWELRSVPCHP